MPEGGAAGEGVMVRRALVNLLRSTRSLQVLEVEICEGAGVDGNPLRIVKYYLDCETGKMLARVDECQGEDAPARITEAPE